MGQNADGCVPRNSVFQALMIAFRMIVRHVLPDCVLEGCPPEEDHSAQTLLFN
jgi:coenzyme F420-reducing hydrogenase gamma subunit